MHHSGSSSRLRPRASDGHMAGPSVLFTSKTPASTHTEYFEVLDRVNLVSTSSQRNSEKIGALAKDVCTMNERVAGVARSTSILQTGTDTLELEIHKLRSEFMNLAEKFNDPRSRLPAEGTEKLIIRIVSSFHIHHISRPSSRRRSPL